jgi:hypothetical protein
MNKKFKKVLLFLVLIAITLFVFKKVFDYKYYIGKKIDSFNNVSVYYNGNPKNVNGRNLTKDGYNLGLKYQCVEFVKRYYFEYLNHKMPKAYGHAKDFYNSSVEDGCMNKERDLFQFHNSSSSKPKVNDLLVFNGSLLNKFGHVAIISKVLDNKIEIVQQNVFLTTREEFDLGYQNQKWKIDNNRILGWLRKKQSYEKK